jgi:D-alanyl-D-alanine carboxypeptidase
MKLRLALAVFILAIALAASAIAMAFRGQQQPAGASMVVASDSGALTASMRAPVASEAEVSPPQAADVAGEPAVPGQTRASEAAAAPAPGEPPAYEIAEESAAGQPPALEDSAQAVLGEAPASRDVAQTAVDQLPASQVAVTVELPPLQAEPAVAIPPEPDFLINGRAAAVLEGFCGALVHGWNEAVRLAPASLTKMMTALVAREHLPDVNAPVTVGVSGSQMARTTGSSIMGLEPGMRVTVQDLLYGLMLPSGNDAAVALAQASTGDVGAFVGRMNEKAVALGLTDTHFVNPHGLDQAGIYSSAGDMARLGLAMMQDPYLAQIAGAPDYKTAGGMSMRNSNKILRQYPGSYGVKIGFTGAAQHTIVAAAERDGRHLYVSVLGSQTSYDDTARLFDWAFNNTRPSC